MRTVNVEHEGGVYRPMFVPYVWFRCGYNFASDEYSLRILWSPRSRIKDYEPAYRHGFTFVYWRPMHIRFSNLWPFRVRWW